jgi:hypothetical protein
MKARAPQEIRVSQTWEHVADKKRLIVKELTNTHAVVMYLETHHQTRIKLDHLASGDYRHIDG